MEVFGFRAGDEVELRGLSKLEMNGQRGTVLPLESVEQAKSLGRLAVMLRSGKQLSVKAENLFKAPPPRAIKTGGDLGEEWSARLNQRRMSMGLPLREQAVGSYGALDGMPPSGRGGMSLGDDGYECSQPLEAYHDEVTDLVPVRCLVHREGLQEMPLVGFGTCFMPEDMKERVPDKDFTQRADELTEECVMQALNSGVRLFDCSNKYVSQSAVGRTLETAIEHGLVARTDLFISGRILRCTDEAEVRREVDLMLKELRVEYVDLLTMDIPPEQVPAAWSWLEEVYREGRARFLGVSNFDLLGPKVCVEVFRDFVASAAVPPAVYLMEVHPFNVNAEMSDCCKALGLQVMAYSPVGAPHKVEAYMKVLTKSDARDLRPLLKVPENPTVQDVAKRNGVTGVQAVLRWNLQRGHSIVPKSFDSAHVVENTELFHFTLGREDMVILSGLHKGLRAERFFTQAFSSGRKALPQMTREAMDQCQAILRQVRGPPPAPDGKMPSVVMDLHQKGKGKGKVNQDLGFDPYAHYSLKGVGKGLSFPGKGTGPEMLKGGRLPMLTGGY